MAINMCEEQEHLNGLTEELKAEAERLAEKMRFYSDASGEHIRYYWENQSQFDGYEALFNQLALQRLVDSGEKSREQFRRIGKMLDSPYFARIDFREEGEPEAMKVYIGKFSFWSSGSDYEVFDWRAPISGMYYEFEYGDAWYDAPAGRVSGYIDLKRQYRIRRGILEYALESGINIGDEVLQRELAENSDHKMRDIVATIQKEQNCLIRNESARVLIVQGAAGSGKTSIALHRVAYFLYRFREEISAENFLILSPNGIFVDYVSNVLPELGEGTIKSICMDDIAARYLPVGLRAERLCYQTERYQEAVEEVPQTAKEMSPIAGNARENAKEEWKTAKETNLAAEETEQTAQETQKTAREMWLERNAYKGTAEFLGQLEAYLAECDTRNFTVSDYPYRNGFLEAEYIRRNYARRIGMPVRPRLRELAGVLEEEIRNQRKGKGWGTGRKEIFDWLMSKFRSNDALLLYRDFYRHMDREELFVWEEDTELESGDIFPLIYVKLHLEGCGGNPGIKYLIVDEMQDYTPVQYAVLNRLYPCRKTILGDFSQRIVPFVQNSLEFMRELYPEAEVMEVRKSYRSTFEIMEFARTIRSEASIEPVRRHGEPPQVLKCRDIHEERERILEFVRSANEPGDSAKLGIVCKSYSLAEELYQWLLGHVEEPQRLHMLTYDSEEFYDGVMITAVSMSKGLEFDEVMIPDASDLNYNSEYDRGLLYVACTRAMHRLTLLCCGEPSRFLERQVERF